MLNDRWDSSTWSRSLAKNQATQKFSFQMIFRFCFPLYPIGESKGKVLAFSKFVGPGNVSL